MYITTADGGSYRGVSGAMVDRRLREMQPGETIPISSHTLRDGTAPRIDLRKITSRTYEFRYADSPASHSWGRIPRHDARQILMAHMRRENSLKNRRSDGD